MRNFPTNYIDMKKLPPIHFTDSRLINPPNPISVNLIGVGGTGSQVLTGLAKINHALIALGHPGLAVRAFDGDRITEANLGRQAFAEAELGLNKAVALIQRINRFFGTGWKAIPEYYADKLPEKFKSFGRANIFISCVDKVATRFQIAKLLQNYPAYQQHLRDSPYYWIDCGNGNDSGQVILSTIVKIKQPQSKKYQTVATLPFITTEFKELLEEQAGQEHNSPSCSLAEALTHQDLFINSFIAQICCKLFWGMLREGLTDKRGVFVNLRDFRTQPLKVA